MSYIDPGVYQLYIEINMITGEISEVPLRVDVSIDSSKSTNKYIESIFTKEGKVFYSKTSV